MSKKKLYKGTKVGFKPSEKGLANTSNKKSKGSPTAYRASIAPKAVARTRQDIASWNQALKMTKLLENPKWWKLQQLFDEVWLDALLQSQVKNRMLKVLAERPVLKKPNGEIDKEQTTLLQNALFTKEINRHILDSNYRIVSLIEFSFDDDGELQVDLIPRANLDPVNGFFYPDYTEDKKIPYREASEYGTWLLEFYEKGNEGLFNSAVPHVLFKRFAESCWSELCEINGIPPRVLKTNTQDPTMVKKGEEMMRNMGAAAWFIIDESESFEWAKAVTQNGDVYNNLITLCNNEISLLFSGAIIGQDTKNGSRSKDESAQEMLQVLIDNDLDVVEKYWNSDIIPALVSLGVLKGELTYGYEQSEDIGQLFEFTKGLLTSGKNVDDKWLEEKFGVKVTGDKPTAGSQNLILREDFFD